jgi:hypothetical protein
MTEVHHGSTALLGWYEYPVQSHLLPLTHSIVAGWRLRLGRGSRLKRLRQQLGRVRRSEPAGATTIGSGWSGGMLSMHGSRWGQDGSSSGGREEGEVEGGKEGGGLLPQELASLVCLISI